MVTSQIVIGAVAKKREGLTDALRPWTLWAITAANGIEFTTFDGVIAHRAFEAVGRQADVEYEIDGSWRKVTRLTVTERSEAA